MIKDGSRTSQVDETQWSASFGDMTTVVAEEHVQVGFAVEHVQAEAVAGEPGQTVQRGLTFGSFTPLSATTSGGSGSESETIRRPLASQGSLKTVNNGLTYGSGNSTSPTEGACRKRSPKKKGADMQYVGGPRQQDAVRARLSKPALAGLESACQSAMATLAAGTAAGAAGQQQQPPDDGKSTKAKLMEQLTALQSTLAEAMQAEGGLDEFDMDEDSEDEDEPEVDLDYIDEVEEGGGGNGAPCTSPALSHLALRTRRSS